MRIMLASLAALLLVACNQSSTPDAPTTQGASGSTREGAEAPPAPPATEDSPAEVAAAPLGSQENPVRCDMPAGQRAYLDRLRCPDGSRPRYERLGSYGVGPHGNVLDGYRVLCGERETTIYMDMYHLGHIENEPVPGFDIVQ